LRHNSGPRRGTVNVLGYERPTARHSPLADTAGEAAAARRPWQRSSWVARIGEGGDLLKCSFCGKSQKQVKKLIAGPGVYICDECIDLCNEIIEEELSEPPELKWDSLPKPREIYEFLDAYVIGQEKAKTVSSWPSPTSCCSARPDPARRCSPRRSPGCSTCRSRSPTPPR
jgi:hypothetical protein